MVKLIKAKEKHINWYNEFYKNGQTSFTSWYSFMLPELIKKIKNDSKILELGCGQSKGLRYLVSHNYIKQENIYGIDQSNVAIEFLKKKLPKANLEQGNIYSLKFNDDTFDYVLMMEVIEHLEDPLKALKEVKRVLKPNGELIISFPNYLNFPWLIVRILSEKLNKPNWIILQPVDKIYTAINIINFCKKNSLKYQKCIGSNYYPPLLWKYENKCVTKLFNKLHLYHLSFHPILFFRKLL